MLDLKGQPHEQFCEIMTLNIFVGCLIMYNKKFCKLIFLSTKNKIIIVEHIFPVLT
jgi:hypothetical protein